MCGYIRPILQLAQRSDRNVETFTVERASDLAFLIDIPSLIGLIFAAFPKIDVCAVTLLPSTDLQTSAVYALQ